MKSAVPTPKIPAPATMLASDATANQPSSLSARLIMRYSAEAKDEHSQRHRGEQIDRQQVMAVCGRVMGDPDARRMRIWCVGRREGQRSYVQNDRDRTEDRDC